MDVVNRMKDVRTIDLRTLVISHLVPALYPFISANGSSMSWDGRFFEGRQSWKRGYEEELAGTNACGAEDVEKRQHSKDAANSDLLRGTAVHMDSVVI
jgi:hypothetical protein